MFFTFHVVVVCESDNNYNPLESDVKSDLGIDTIMYLPNNRDILMKYLISSCDANKFDVIIITSTSTIAFDVTRKVINKDISTNIVTSVSKLEQQLKSLFHSVVCGIRNKTLVINIYGSREDAAICVTTYEEMINRITELITCNTMSRDETIHDTELKSLEESLEKFIEVTDAQQIIRDEIIRSNEKIVSKCVKLHDAYGKILLTDIYATCNVPSFKTSANHGFAIKANDKTNKMKVLKEGSTFLESGTCVQVKTGAPIPDEATAVIKIENASITLSNNDTCEEIEIIIRPDEGENIKPIGCEIKMGEKILDKYTCIGLTEIRLLASCGIIEVEVLKPHTIGILSIGKEIKNVKDSIDSIDTEYILKLKQSYDSNELALITLLMQKGFDALYFGIVDVDMLKISVKVQEALQDVNILVIIGSPDGREELKIALRDHFKANIHFDNVNMKPGKLTTYGTCMIEEKKKHILYLPGDSSTVLITAHLFLLPLLKKMHYNDSEVPVICACIMNKYKKHSRPSYMWARLKWDPEEKETFAKVFNTQGNNNLLKSHNANALLIIPTASSISADTLTPVLFLGSN